MRSLRARFILSHILPILLIVPLVGALLVFLIETQVLLTDLAKHLTAEATLIAETVSANPNIILNETTAEEYVARLGFVLEGEIILLQSDGEILASSDREPGIQADTIFQLEGLEKALAGEQSVKVTHGWFQQKGEVLIPINGINEQLIGIVGITHAVEGVASRFERLRWLVLVILVIELILGLLAGLVLALRLEQPIERAATAVIGIADGEYVEPIPEQGPKDIQRLSASVNLLSERLRILEESRRNLLANIVHELGRPLGAILAAIHVLRQSAGNEPEIRDELLAGIENEIQRMQPLLEDLAQLHGQVLGNYQLNKMPVVINDWLPPLLLPWRAAAREKGLEWTATISPNLPTLNLDADRMAQVVGNLLSNAIKYTPKGGSVSISADADRQEIHIQISDTGPGINPEEMERIFEPFFRSQQQKRFPQGLGLGLTIARDIVTAHGGLLEMNSSPGEGSQFTIVLPIATSLDGED